MTPSADWLPHLAHWGAFSARWDGQALQVRPHPDDPDPNPLIDNLPAAVQHRARVAQPMVRRGWLERGPGPDTMRGREEFVPLSWDAALELTARELKRVQEQHGPQAIFGGSYGWSSAGRFHHAQSQVHRFLNTTFGGYVRSVNISPLRDDLPAEAQAEWRPVKPATDTALMLALVHTLVTEGLHDQAFIDRYCHGWPEFLQYLLGQHDQQPKDARWAAPLCGWSAHDIVELARSLPGRRVLVVVAHSLQRARHGEQPVWMAAVLASVLGQIGLPGAGYNYALGSLAHYGHRYNTVGVTALPQGRNGVKAFIPVARIADMLLHPGEPFDYDGTRHTYPHIKLAYWAGGNPFHHHQDLHRLRDAFCRLDTLIVNEIAWTATARHADIVLPSTMTLEREDIGGTPTDPLLVAMHRVVPPAGQARDDYDIFAALAERLGRMRAAGCGISTSAPGPSCGSRAMTRRISTPSGGKANTACPSKPTTGGSCEPFAGTPRPTHSRRPAAGYRSARPALPRLVTPIARGIPPGLPPWTRPRRSTPCNWWPTSPPPGCTASSISVHTARRPSAGIARSVACTRLTHTREASPIGISCGCSTTAAPAWRAHR